MIGTFKISFSLKNTYRVNAILYSLRQIPGIRRLLPGALFKVRGLKIFACVLAAIWELATVFLGKFIYFITMVTGIGVLYEGAATQAVFLHILFFLTIIGGFTNTNLFNPTKDKFYAVILMRMDARAYTRTNYGYSIIKVIVGFMPVILFFGMHRSIPIWLCLALPFSIAGLKMSIAAWSLMDYERRGLVYNENKLGKWLWSAVALLLFLAYALPALGFTLPAVVSGVLFLIFIPLGVAAALKIWNFSDYRSIYQQLAVETRVQMDTAANASRTQAEKSISADRTITSTRKGFEYLNELFVKRHRKILWSASKKITLCCLTLICIALVALYLIPEARETINRLMMSYLPYFVFVMYLLNRGMGFTRALFINCDHSLLTYPFYKQPRMILKLFAIRLREIMKINLLPAAVIGVGLALLLFASGGTENPLNYLVIVVSVLCMSMFFSVHNLTLYYLLQPYNAATELKSGTYQLVSAVTYVVCYAMIRVQLPTLMFGTACIAFCLLYCAVACILVYHFAPRTFRIRT